MKVEILSRKLIAPSSPTAPHLQKSPISFLGQVAPSIYEPRIYFYPADEGDHLQEDGHVNVNEERSKHLQSSLSEILTLFYPLGGRYIKDDSSVHCNDKGAEYLEVQINISLSEILKRVDQQQLGLLNLLVHLPSESDDAPLVTVQFNKLECGGIAIGIVDAHRILDGYSAFAFINAFATASRIGADKVDQHCSKFQLASIIPPRDANDPIFPSQEVLKSNNNALMKRFVFSGAAITKLKAAVVNGASLDDRLPTRVEAVIALIWHALIKVAKARNGRLRPSISRIAINLRGRTKLPIPDHCFGNFIGKANAKFTPNGENNIQLHDLVGRVRDALRSTITDIANAFYCDDLALVLSNDIQEANEAQENSEVDVFVFASWCRFPMYDADFGWGKPVWVSTASIPVVSLSKLMDTKDGDGMEAWICLDEKDMLLFEKDVDIITFSSQEKQL